VWVNASIDADVKLGIVPTGEWRAALDPADEGIDKNALAIAHGIRLEHLEQWSGKESDPYATVERAFLICDTNGSVRHMIYDADGGLGGGVRGDARKINQLRNPAHIISVSPYRASGAVLEPKKEMVDGRKNEDRFLNFNAQSGWSLRMRFYQTYRAVVKGEKGFDPDSIISIPADIPERAQLLIELSQPTYTTNQMGKLLIEKKPDGTPSPNLFDAVKMLYAPARRALKIADSLLGDDPIEE
jgi:hypothetical protein